MNNGIEKITDRLLADAQAAADSISAENDEACKKLRAEYTVKAQKAYDEAMENGNAALKARLSRIDSAAEMESRKAVLAFKQEMVSVAFVRAQELLSSLPREEYISFLAKQAANAAVTGQEELIFNESDRKEVGSAVAKEANKLLKVLGKDAVLTVSAQTRTIPGGLIVKQGDIETNCALDTLTQLYRGELASKVAEVLFA